MTVTRRIAGKTRVRLDRAILTVADGPDTGRGTQLEEGVLTIGTDSGSGFCLTDPTVSRRHAEISRTSEGFLLQDVGSTNGTFINGVRVDRAYLRDGTTITLGKSEIGFRLNEETFVPSPSRTTCFGEMIGRGKSMREIFSLLERLSGSDVTVLLQGETGTGKELAARGLHAYGPRSSMPFVVFNCAAVPSELMESELFGFEKGAFTGADASRKGAVEEAEGGTLFLDEIGELSLSLQPKLLRLLDRREFKRLGEAGERHSNVRFVAATNRDLEAQVMEGTFRQDLFFRTSAARVKLPPLRERPEDVPALLEHFQNEISRRTGKRLRLTEPALNILCNHAWPGNVRELKNVLETAGALCGGETIGPEDLPPLSRAVPRDGTGSMRNAEVRALREAMEMAGGNKRKAARLLGIAPSTLYAKMRKYKI